MKKGALLLMLGCMGFLSYAQIERKVIPATKTDSILNKPVQPAAGEMDKREIMKDLNLTKEQRAKMKEIRQSGKAKREAISNDTKLTDAEKQTQLRALQKEQLQNTMNILNEEQKKKMRTMMTERRTGKQQPRN